MENLTTLENEELREVIGGGNSWKCAAGSIGQFINGGITGAAAGSAVPALGTFVGGVIGASAGIVYGAATYC